MPDLGGGIPKKSLDLSDVDLGNEADAKPKKKAQPAPSRPQGNGAAQRAVDKAKQKATLFSVDDEDDDDDEDEVIQASLNAKKNNKVDPKLLGIGGIAVVVILIFCFVLFGGKEEEEPVTTKPTTQQTTKPSSSSSNKNNTDSGLGIQDFTQNTTMTSSSPLSNPNGYVEDINGLTTQVNYNVTSIQSGVVDFVNYTKKRGTWGGGLELYWLDCTYKGNQYVIQVPFKYYKELDDTGIVPVKMEVLYVKQPTGETLTIVSYMCLDEATLKAVLKASK